MCVGGGGGSHPLPMLSLTRQGFSTPLKVILYAKEGRQGESCDVFQSETMQISVPAAAAETLERRHTPRRVSPFFRFSVSLYRECRTVSGLQR